MTDHTTAAGPDRRTIPCPSCDRLIAHPQADLLPVELVELGAIAYATAPGGELACSRCGYEFDTVPPLAPAPEGCTCGWAPRDACNVHYLAERPRALVYDHLTPGVEGYWPVIAGVPDDVEPGDRVSFAGDVEGDVVAEVERETCRAWPCRIGYVTPDGRRFTIGRMAGRTAGDPAFRLDRWGTHATLSTRGAR